MNRQRTKSQGFTLLELVVVLVIIALLASISVPVVSTAIYRAKESALKETLLVTRKALDDYYADHERYPDSLDVLVSEKYLRTLPIDPMVEADATWELVMSDDYRSGIIDLKSTSTDQARNGSYYNEW